jgi:hypothetical protein
VEPAKAEVAASAAPAVEPPPVAPPPVQPPPATPAPPVQPPAQRPGPAQPAARKPATAAVPVAAAVVATPPPPPLPPPDQPAARKPEAVKPGPERPRAAARPAQQETPPPNPGDLVCGNCGIGNDPARKFCRRCGQSLATATIAVAPRIPWYRRIFGGGRTARAAAAGERPKSMRKDGKTGGGIRIGRLFSTGFQVILLAVVIGAVAGYLLVPGFKDAVNGAISSVREMVSPPADPVSTAGKATGPSSKDHPAQLAFDGTTAYWAAPFVDGQPPTIQAVFSPSADVSKVLVTAGAPGESFKALARPRDVTFEFLDDGGTVIASKAYELKDVATAQPFDVGAKGAAKVRLTVRSVYLAEKANAPVAITEIEFFGKSQGGPSPTP